MKSVYQAKKTIYQLLRSQNAKQYINGNIYIDTKPNGSKLEDIVVNAISSDAEILQEIILNVNCYVPFYEEKVNGIVQKFVDNERLSEIFDNIYPILDKVNSPEYDCIIERHEEFNEEQEEMSYINFRINLIMYNNL